MSNISTSCRKISVGFMRYVLKNCTRVSKMLVTSEVYFFSGAETFSVDGLERARETFWPMMVVCRWPPLLEFSWELRRGLECFDARFRRGFMC